MKSEKGVNTSDVTNSESEHANICIGTIGGVDPMWRDGVGRGG